MVKESAAAPLVLAWKLTLYLPTVLNYEASPGLSVISHESCVMVDDMLCKTAQVVLASTSSCPYLVN